MSGERLAIVVCILLGSLTGLKMLLTSIDKRGLVADKEREQGKRIDALGQSLSDQATEFRLIIAAISDKLTQLQNRMQR